MPIFSMMFDLALGNLKNNKYAFEEKVGDL